MHACVPDAPPHRLSHPAFLPPPSFPFPSFPFPCSPSLAPPSFLSSFLCGDRTSLCFQGWPGSPDPLPPEILKYRVVSSEVMNGVLFSYEVFPLFLVRVFMAYVCGCACLCMYMWEGRSQSRLLPVTLPLSF